MTDAELRDAAVKHLQATTISYPEWMHRKATGKYTPASLAATQWQQAFDALALIDPPAPPPVKRKGYELTLTPNWGPTKAEAASDIESVWVYARSTESYHPPNGTDPYTVLLLDPRMKDLTGKAGCDEWYFAIRRDWPTSYDPTKHGDFATQANFHNVATNEPPNSGGGVGWGFGSPVSALFLGWWQTTPTLHLEFVKSGGLDVPLPSPAQGANEYVVRFVAGRTDGTTVRPGAWAVKVNGHEWAGSTGPVNTIQAAPYQGVSYTQRWMAANWDGDYTKHLAVPSSTGFQVTGVGRTEAEALADLPAVVGDTMSGQVWNGNEPNVGPPTLKALP